MRTDSIKRAARKEAWYGESWNPFRKTTRSPTGLSNDLESQRLATSSTSAAEPGRGSSQDGINEDSKNGNGNGKINGTMGRTSNPDSEPTIDKRESTGRGSARPASQEIKARRQFLRKFQRNKTGSTNASDEDNKKPVKQPWWKGKDVPHDPFTVRNQLNATIFNSWINVLLIAAPVGIALNYAGVNGIAVFVVNFIAIIPLAAMLSFATEEIALHVGESLGGLLNASFGYASM